MQFKRAAAWKEAAWIFGLSRLMILLFSYLAVTFLHMHPHINTLVYIALKKCSPGINCFLMSWWRWDAVHYVEIANGGYRLPLIAFFPLFPLLMRGLGYLLGGSVLADYAAGLLIANSCFYGVLVLFYHLICQDFDRSTARMALIYLTFAPYAIFFFAGYTESLFLLLTLATFYFLRRRKLLDWWLAGLCGMLATLTRAVGIVLSIPFIVLLLQEFSVYTLLTKKNWQRKLNAIVPIMLIPVGLLLYMLYQWRIFGNPWLFSIEQFTLWARYPAFPWVGLFNAIHGIFVPGPFFWQDNVNDLLFTLIPLIAFIVGWRLLPFDYNICALFMIIFILCEPYRNEPLLEVPRYLLVIFPVFIIFALWSKNSRMARYLILSLSILFFIENVIQFAIYGWVL